MRTEELKIMLDGSATTSLTCSSFKTLGCMRSGRTLRIICYCYYIHLCNLTSHTLFVVCMYVLGFFYPFFGNGKTAFNTSALLSRVFMFSSFVVHFSFHPWYKNHYKITLSCVLHCLSPKSNAVCVQAIFTVHTRK